MYFPEDEHIAQVLQNEPNFQNLDSRLKCLEKENKNPVDSELEFIDPTPNIHDLFIRFNEKFFWGALGMVEVKWSNRMTQCAGLCYFEGKQGLCKICLSAPLLSFRPRKDLVETLLHEMIHAYLFVTSNFKDREDHGPEFRSHMLRINKQAGTNISVYHTFYDEVEFYKCHIWRCDGPCRLQKPYFGFVRRSMNRAPGPNDHWWGKHKVHCGGTFIKISQPQQKPKINKVIKKSHTKNKLNDIRTFFKSDSPTRSSLDKISDKTATNKNLVKTKTKAKEVESVTFASFRNVPVNLKDTNLSNNSQKLLTSLPAFTQVQIESSKDLKGDVRDVVRSVWINKFYSKPEDSEKPVCKKIKIHCSPCEQDNSNNCSLTHKEPVKECKNESNETSSFKEQEIEELKSCPVCNKEILKSEMNDHLEKCVKCSFVIEGTDEKLKDEILCQSLPCPCCHKHFLESQMNNHLDECLTLIALKEESFNS